MRKGKEMDFHEFLNHYKVEKKGIIVTVAEKGN
jgi:hypothetical protein